jgi:ATP-dependent RNA helicase HelY
MDDLAPGDVLHLRGHRLAVLSVSHRKGGVRVRVLDTDARVTMLGEDDFDEPPVSRATLRLPDPFDPRDRAGQRRLTAQLRKVKLRRGASDATTSSTAAASAADHPVAGCPDLRAHLEAASERDRLDAQIADLDRRLAERTGTLVRQFDRLHDLLERRGFVAGWTLTSQGALLSRIFHECDLLCASVLADGLLDDLEPAEIAGVVSMITYEHRAKDLPPAPWYPSARVRDRAERVEALARSIIDAEERAGLTPTRLPDATFLAIAHAWAAGESLEVVLEDDVVSGGDFVRNVKTLVDLLRQIAAVAPVRETARSASAAADALLRGVVAASNEVTVALDPEGSTSDGGAPCRSRRGGRGARPERWPPTGSWCAPTPSCATSSKTRCPTGGPRRWSGSSGATCAERSVVGEGRSASTAPTPSDSPSTWARCGSTAPLATGSSLTWSPAARGGRGVWSR